MSRPYRVHEHFFPQTRRVAPGFYVRLLWSKGTGARRNCRSWNKKSPDARWKGESRGKKSTPFRRRASIIRPVGRISSRQSATNLPVGHISSRRRVTNLPVGRIPARGRASKLPVGRIAARGRASKLPVGQIPSRRSEPKLPVGHTSSCGSRTNGSQTSPACHIKLSEP
jgi:hypothetical protein